MYRALILFVALGVSLQMVLFYVKYEVVKREREYLSIRGQIYKCQQSLHVLEAEWAHLNELDRIERLSKRYLTDLVPVMGNQIVSLNDFPDASLKEVEVEVFKPNVELIPLQTPASQPAKDPIDALVEKDHEPPQRKISLKKSGDKIADLLKNDQDFAPPRPVQSLKKGVKRKTIDDLLGN